MKKYPIAKPHIGKKEEKYELADFFPEYNTTVPKVNETKYG